MDNAQKAIMIGVGLFLTILVISIVLLVTNLGIGTTKNAGDRISTISTGLQNQLITQYDRKLITGNDVSYAINQYQTQLKNNLYLITVAIPKDHCLTGSTAGVITANVATNTEYYKTGSLGATGTNPQTLALMVDKVNVNALYKAFLIKDAATMNVLGLCFVEQT